MTPTEQRDQAARLARTDTTTALEVARRIDDPWFGCQALGWVARFAPDDRVAELVEEALAVARRAVDPYRTVGAAAWPVRALVERQRWDRLPVAVTELLEASGRIEPPASHSEALFLLFQAGLPAGSTLWRPVFDALLAASDSGAHWRQRRNLRDAVLMVARVDSRFAADIAGRLSDEKTRTKIEQCLSRREARTPRTFFW